MARKVTSFPVSTGPIPYEQMKNQCEALVTGNLRKMSVFLSFKQQQEPMYIGSPKGNEKISAFSHEVKYKNLLGGGYPPLKSHNSCSLATLFPN